MYSNIINHILSTKKNKKYMEFTTSIAQSFAFGC